MKGIAPTAPAPPGFDDDDHLAAFRVFAASARAILEEAAPLRRARAPDGALREAARAALADPPRDAAGAREFFRARFAFRELRRPDGGAAFFTGYYEPEIAGATAPSPAFPAPVFARPSDLVAFAPGDGPAHLDPAFAGARRRPGGALEPYPDRAAIYADALGPGAEVAAWLEDDVEVFMAQVQGSARLRLDGGGTARLVYDGRNGRPYVSIGASLIADGSIAPAAMSLANLKAWLRAAGLKPGEAGRARLERNPSYVFFRLERDVDPALGPIGGAGLALTPLRSIAVDRTLHAYGTPIFVGAELPWHEPSPEPFRRLTIAQDTGSAIVGPARFDLFMGSGDEAGARAGDIRHEGRAWALEAI